MLNSSHTQESALTKKLEESQKEIERLNKMIQELKSSSESAEALRQTIQEQSKQLENKDKKIRTLEQQIAKLSNEVESYKEKEKPIPERVLALRKKGLSFQQIADEVGLSKPGVQYHIEKLREEGLLS